MNRDLFADIEIIYENDDIVVINKPDGLVVTPFGKYKEEDCIVGWLLNRYGEKIETVGNETHRPGIVHRLDRGTSGILIAAKTQYGFEKLTSQFKERTIQKHYVALAWGKIEPWEFIIDAPIKRSRSHTMRFVLDESGRPSETKCAVEAVVNIDPVSITKVNVYPKTGRTHQIRVHLKAKGNTIVGDELYQGRSERELFFKLVDQGQLVRRMYLHALSISCIVPGEEDKGVQQFLTRLPDEFQLIPDNI
ncbi:RluA family pseudouridine synthase [candidate division WWE3 bacterium]|nr:RluA family pseudouridine synthase [candidate division WWE3 bacterium]